MKKRCFTLFLLLVIISLLIAPTVCAANAGSEFGKSIAPAIDIIKTIFSFGGLQKEGNMVIFLRIAIWIICFIVLWAAARFIPSLQGMRNPMIVLAVVLATVTTVFIPAELLRTFGETYASILIWLILGAPIAGALALVFLALPANNRFVIGLRIILLILAWWVATKVTNAWDTKTGLFAKGVLNPIVIPFAYDYFYKIKKKVKK